VSQQDCQIVIVCAALRDVLCTSGRLRFSAGNESNRIEQMAVTAKIGTEREVKSGSRLVIFERLSTKLLHFPTWLETFLHLLHFEPHANFLITKP
jgi:hypothetical protein